MFESSHLILVPSGSLLVSAVSGRLVAMFIFPLSFLDSVNAENSFRFLSGGHNHIRRCHPKAILPPHFARRMNRACFTAGGRGGPSKQRRPGRAAPPISGVVT